MSDEVVVPPATYNDDDLVYVDPETKSVVARVEFLPNGKHKPLARPQPEPDPEKADRKPRIRYYPWGTYRSMKKIYKIEGKVIEEERRISLDDAIAKSMIEPYWN